MPSSPRGEEEPLFLCSQDFDEQLLDSLACVSRGAVEACHVLDGGVATGYQLPQVHSQLGWQTGKVVSHVLDLSIVQLTIEDVLSFHLLNESVVLVDDEVLHQVHTTLIDDVLDGHLTLVVLDEVIEGYCTLKADERRGQVVEDRAEGYLVELGEGTGQTLPRTTGWVNLVRLIVTFVLKVIVVLIDEVPNLRQDVALCPIQASPRRLARHRTPCNGPTQQGPSHRLGTESRALHR